MMEAMEPMEVDENIQEQDTCTRRTFSQSPDSHTVLESNSNNGSVNSLVPQRSELTGNNRTYNLRSTVQSSENQQDEVRKRVTFDQDNINNTSSSNNSEQFSANSLNTNGVVSNMNGYSNNSHTFHTHLNQDQHLKHARLGNSNVYYSKVDHFNVALLIFILGVIASFFLMHTKVDLENECVELKIGYKVHLPHFVFTYLSSANDQEHVEKPEMEENGDPVATEEFIDNTEIELQEMIHRNRISIVAFLSSTEDSESSRNFDEALRILEEDEEIYPVKTIRNPSLARKYGGVTESDRDLIIVYREYGHTSVSSRDHDYGHDCCLSTEQIVRFVKSATTPLMLEFSDDTLPKLFDKYLRERLRIVLHLSHKGGTYYGEYPQVFMEFARQHREKFLLVRVDVDDSSNHAFLRAFGAKSVMTPRIQLLRIVDNCTKADGLNTTNLNDFVDVNDIFQLADFQKYWKKLLETDFEIDDLDRRVTEYVGPHFTKAYRILQGDFVRLLQELDGMDVTERADIRQKRKERMIRINKLSDQLASKVHDDGKICDECELKE